MKSIYFPQENIENIDKFVMTYLVYLIFTTALVVGLIVLGYLLSQVQTTSEKVSPYE